MSDIDTQLDEIIASIAGDVYDYADGVVGGRDEAVYSAAQSHKRALEALIAQQVKEARIDEILDYAEVFFDDSRWEDREKLKPTHSELKQSIKRLIDQQVKEARLDELIQATNAHSDYLSNKTWFSDHFDKRIEELTK